MTRRGGAGVRGLASARISADRAPRNGASHAMLASFMPPLSTLAFYALACVALAATPGPDMAVFIGKTLSGGRRLGYAALAGAMAGLLVHTVAAALGLSALLAASAGAFKILKIVGALYLLWLAVGALRHGAALPLDAAGGPEPLAKGFRTGFLINLTNPKIILFFVTFLPQFIVAGDPNAWEQLLFLGVSFIVIGAMVNAVIIALAAGLAAKVKARPKALRGFDYGFAGLMGLVAARLLWTAE
jgi:threonine/homoserine/homoserine lactone efflux protein